MYSTNVQLPTAVSDSLPHTAVGVPSLAVNCHAVPLTRHVRELDCHLFLEWARDVDRKRKK